MFGKKRCRKCGEKVSSSYNYCPYCQVPLKRISEDEDWGLLGRNDFAEPDEMKLPMGLNTLFNSLMNNLNNQVKEMNNSSREIKDQKVSKKSG